MSPTTVLYYVVRWLLLIVFRSHKCTIQNRYAAILQKMLDLMSKGWASLDARRLTQVWQLTHFTPIQKCMYMQLVIWSGLSDQRARCKVSSVVSFSRWTGYLEGNLTYMDDILSKYESVFRKDTNPNSREAPVIVLCIDCTVPCYILSTDLIHIQTFYCFVCKCFIHKVSSSPFLHANYLIRYRKSGIRHSTHPFRYWSFKWHRNSNTSRDGSWR